MRRKLTRALACFASAAAFGAALANCTQDTTVSSIDVSASIGPSGGVVSTANGEVDVPGGALTEDVTLTVEDVGNAPSLTQATQVGPAILCEPEGTQFADPVTITLPFKASELPPGKTSMDIVIYTAPGTGTVDYTPLQTSITPDGEHVSAQTTHFSYFVPVVPGAGPQDSGVRDVTTVTGFDSNQPNDDTNPPPPPPPDTAPPMMDTGMTKDVAMTDTAAPDVIDAGTDTMAQDSAPVDTGQAMPDTGTSMPDTGTSAPETGPADTGSVVESSTTMESGSPESGTDDAD